MQRHELRRSALRLVLLLALITSTGCGAQHIYQTDDLSEGAPRPGQNTPATLWHEETRHALLWGLIRQDHAVTNCQDASGETWGIEEVRIRTTPLYWLASTVTLGIWSPSKIGHRCAKPCAPTDEL